MHYQLVDVTHVAECGALFDLHVGLFGLNWPSTSTEDSGVPLPLNDYISGSTRGGLYNTRFYECGPNTWTRTRKAVRRLGVRIDVSCDEVQSSLLLKYDQSDQRYDWIF